MSSAATAALRSPQPSHAARGSTQILVAGCVWLWSLTFVWSVGAMALSTVGVAVALISEAALRGPARSDTRSGVARIMRVMGWLVAFSVTAFYCAVVAVVRASRW